MSARWGRTLRATEALARGCVRCVGVDVRLLLGGEDVGAAAVVLGDKARGAVVAGTAVCWVGRGGVM